MIERNQSYITVYRRGSEYVKVPITPACIVKYTLMKEYHIKLSFVSAQPATFLIGDYIEDEIFGRFYIIDEQTPKDNGGVYQYELMFHAPCYRWKNRKMMMVSVLPTGVPFRKETVWSLTGTLEQLVSVLLENVRICGFGNYKVKIEPYIAIKAAECHCITFNGTDILAALNTLCNSDNWNCEWWVEEEKYSEDGIAYDGTLYLGKCDRRLTEGMEEYNFTPERLQSMNINRSQTSFFNKLYCFGSSNNIPLTYRKEIRLTLDKFIDDCFVPDKKFDKTYFENVKRQQTLSIKDVFFSHAYNTARVEPVSYGQSLSSPITQIQLATSETDGGQDREFEYQEGYASEIHDSWWNAETYGYSGSSKPFVIDDDTAVELSIPEIKFRADNIPSNDNTFAFIVKADVYLRDSNWSKGGYDEKIWQGVNAWNDGHDQGFATSFKDLCQITMPEHKKEGVVLAKGEYHIYISYKIILLAYKELQNEGEKYNVTYPEHIFGSYLTSGADTWSLIIEAEDVRITDMIGRSPIVDAEYFVDGVKRSCKIQFNPKNIANGNFPNSAKYGFMCVNEAGGTYVNEDFTTEDNPQEGKTYEIVISDNDSLNIPTSYYTNKEVDSPFALAQVGDRRLKLPEGEREITDEETGITYTLKDGYIIVKGIEESDLVEEAVIFEKVYPKSRLLVNTVTPRNKRMVEEYDGGIPNDKDIWYWKEYALTFNFADTHEPFNFDKKYMLPGETLKVRFMTPDDVGMEGLPSKGFMLTGMTFEAEYYKNKDNSPEGDYPANSFALVQNKDFGAMLPSADTLYPQEGDAAEVIGWNIKAMAQLGLIDKAENELLTKGIEYIKAVNENNVTVECIPTAQYLFDLRKYQPFYTSDKKPFYTSDEQPFNVRRVNEYELLDIGAPVHVHSDLFKGGVFKSRVIGFEYKLDKPYDNPKYTVGETEAYSRLRQIEKNITKLS